MPMRLCPVCHNRHPVNANYDNEEFICSNSSSWSSPKTFQDITPETLLTKNNYLMNRADTKEDAIRPVTVKVGTEPDFRIGGLKHLETNY